jgi:hypothetical protein
MFKAKKCTSLVIRNYTGTGTFQNAVVGGRTHQQQQHLKPLARINENASGKIRRPIDLPLESAMTNAADSCTNPSSMLSVADGDKLQQNCGCDTIVAAGIIVTVTATDQTPPPKLSPPPSAPSPTAGSQDVGNNRSLTRSWAERQERDCKSAMHSSTAISYLSRRKSSSWPPARSSLSGRGTAGRRSRQHAFDRREDSRLMPKDQSERRRSHHHRDNAGKNLDIRDFVAFAPTASSDATIRSSRSTGNVTATADNSPTTPQSNANGVANQRGKLDRAAGGGCGAVPGAAAAAASSSTTTATTAVSQSLPRMTATAFWNFVTNRYGRADPRTEAERLRLKQQKKKENRARKALRTITIILGAFVLCWTPWHVLSLLIGFCGGGADGATATTASCVSTTLYDISYWLCYLNSPINPFCYAFVNQQFKKTFIRILRLDWHRS